MANSIRHQGIVENINGSHLQVRIVQTSACSSCSIKGHCTSAEMKEKLIDVTEQQPERYHVGDRVMVVGELSMGVQAVLYAFVVPFLVLVISLFTFMHIWHNELTASLGSLALLVPYYYIMYLCRHRMSRKFAFSIRPLL